MLGLSADGVVYAYGAFNDDPVCETHKQGMTLKDLMVDENWRLIRASSAGKGLQRPVRAYSTLSWWAL